MKKSQVLRIGAAIAGTMAVVVPQTASATTVTCTATTTASGVTTCTGGGDGYTQEAVDFTGSKGVSIDAVDDTTDFSACAYHISGSKSFGMTTSLTTMSIRNATGKTAQSGVGCAN